LLSLIALTSNPVFATLALKAVTMPQTIQAIYENGVLRPLQKLDIPERQRLEILILEDDLAPSLIAQAAEQAGSYDFLHHPDEDIYTMEDGEEI
jgi:predicted DNA-binding antitoxin AbrB/MazE fold protein